MFVSADGSTVYVVQDDGDLISIINAATNQITGTAKVGTDPEGIVVSPDGTTAYVANSEDCVVGIFKFASLTQVATIPVGDMPMGIAITPDGNTVYVNNSGAPNIDMGHKAPPCSPNKNTVSVISTASDTVVATINKVGKDPQHGLGITPDQAPSASLTVTPASHGSPTSFDASASTVEFGTITSYAWKFGDGNTAVTSTPTTTHTYASAGSYTATVTETDCDQTSTTEVWYGQTASLNGGPSAETSKNFMIP